MKVKQPGPTYRPRVFGVVAAVWVALMWSAPVEGMLTQAPPVSTPCEAVLAGGTPVVDHTATGQSAFDPSSPEQVGQTGNAADYPFDLVFIDAFIAHREGAIAMAEVALARSERMEIRDLATEIAAASEVAIDQLRDVRTVWYPDADPVPANVVTGLLDEGLMTAGAAGGMGQGSVTSDLGLAVSRLCSVETSFDLAFLTEMIPHHQGGVGMARVAGDRGEHPELIAIAAAIVTKLDPEASTMREWLADWYPAGATGGVDLIVEGTPAA